jgi:hypothetical protein
MKVAIIGKSSIVSQVILRSLESKNHKVKMFGRMSSEFNFDLLNQDFNQISNFDLVIFVAHDHRPSASIQELIYKNYTQTLKLLQSNGQRSIFISTMSASTFNRSEYAKHKLRLESLFESHNFKVVRLGLVVGTYQDIEFTKAFKNISRLANSPIFKFYNSNFRAIYTTNLQIIERWFLRDSFSNIDNVTDIYDNEYASVSEFLSTIRTQQISFIPISLSKVSNMIYFSQLHSSFSIFDKVLNFSDGMSLRCSQAKTT